MRAKWSGSRCGPEVARRQAPLWQRLASTVPGSISVVSCRRDDGRRMAEHDNSTECRRRLREDLRRMSWRGAQRPLVAADSFARFGVSHASATDAGLRARPHGIDEVRPGRGYLAFSPVSPSSPAISGRRPCWRRRGLPGEFVDDLVFIAIGITGRAVAGWHWPSWACCRWPPACSTSACWDRFSTFLSEDPSSVRRWSVADTSSRGSHGPPYASGPKAFRG